jgi:hypothetical protein
MVVGVRRWVAGMGVAGGAAVAAALVGTSVARADTIDLFLSQAEDDMTQVSTLFSGVDSPSTADFLSAIETQSELISQIQTQQDTFSEALQTGSQLVSADQQLSSASGELVAASQQFVNAINAGDLPLSTTESLADKLTAADAVFSFLNAELFQVLPAEFNVGFDTVADGGTLDLAGLDPGLAASAAAVPPIVTSYPFELLKDAGDNLNAATQALDAVPPADVINALAPQLDLQSTALQALGEVTSAETAISTFDNGALADVATPWFNLVDQGWAQGTEALLNADTALEAALSGGSGLPAAELGVLAADLGVLGDVTNSLGIEFTSLLF